MAAPDPMDGIHIASAWQTIPQPAVANWRQTAYDPASWRQVLAGYRSAEAYHSPEWLTFLGETKGVTPIVAELRTESDTTVGHFVGGMIRTGGFRVLGSPLAGWGTNVMGFLLRPGVDRAQAAAALLEFGYNTLGCIHVELRSRAEAMTVPDLPYQVSFRETLEVDLTGSEEDVLSRMRSRTRTYARRAARIGLRVEEVSNAGFADEYYAQLEDVFASRSLVPTYGVERVRALIEIVGPSGQLSMLRLRTADGDPVASILTVGRNGRATLWGLAWHRAAAKLHPVEALQWAAMRYWRERGALVYDLDGTGLGKEKFGGRIGYEVHLRHSRHAMFERARNVIRALFYAQQKVRGRLRG